MKLLYDIYMKKFKNFMRRIGKYTMAIIGCLTFLLCAGLYGCGIEAPEGEEYTAYNLYGTRVLYRPNNYSYSEAVGELGNVRYYNILAFNILMDLYQVYGNYGINKIEAEKFITETQFNYNANEYYYYDNIRYQITNIESTLTTYEGSDYYVGTQKITADTSKGWNWSMGYTTDSGAGVPENNKDTIFGTNISVNNNIIKNNSTYE